MMKFATIFTAIAGCLTVEADVDQAVLQDDFEQRSTEKPFNIAIIGAGAGGSSTAFHLVHPLHPNNATTPPLNITVFERTPYIGGRSTTVNAHDCPDYSVELGASVFVKVNRILNDAVRDFNLSTSNFISTSDEDPPGPKLGVWDGEQFVLTQASGGWWDNAKLLWRYGLAPIKTIRLMRSVVAKFLKLYEEPQFPFASLSETAQGLGLLSAAAATGEQFMSENGITGDFGWDVVQASTRVNYAQNLDRIHGLEAMVCMAVEEAVSVEGGNWKIFEGMVKASGAHLKLKAEVNAVEKRQGGGYEVHFADAEAVNSIEAHHFDAVVLAAPLQFTGLSLPSDLETTPDEIPYVSLHVTVFTTAHLPSPISFNLADSDNAPKTILTTLPKPASSATPPTFYSISLLRSVTNPESNEREYLYKIFSPTPLNATFLTQLFDFPTDPHASIDASSAPDSEFPKQITWQHHILWHSYPEELPRVTFDPSRLDASRGGLWYLNGMESFISTMETSALMGANVAGLIRRELAGQSKVTKGGHEEARGRSEI